VPLTGLVPGRVTPGVRRPQRATPPLPRSIPPRFPPREGDGPPRFMCPGSHPQASRRGAHLSASWALGDGLGGRSCPPPTERERQDAKTSLNPHPSTLDLSSPSTLALDPHASLDPDPFALMDRSVYTVLVMQRGQILPPGGYPDGPRGK
jgi:hypothetical protein